MALALNAASMGLSKLSGGRALKTFSAFRNRQEDTMLSSSFSRSCSFRKIIAMLLDDHSNKLVIKLSRVVGLMDGTEL